MKPVLVFRGNWTINISAPQGIIGPRNEVSYSSANSILSRLTELKSSSFTLRTALSAISFVSDRCVCVDLS